MKIAVYTIALNEEKFARRWAESCAEADYRIVADTGSSDGTVAALRAHGVTVHAIAVRPWRFDHARNANLALVPADAEVCIQLDMDEVLVPGWRQALEAAWVPGTTKLKYFYVWSWTADGQPGRTFFADKIHHRQGYHWKHPIHEVIVPVGGTVEKVARSEAVRIHHHADDTKSRGQYLPLLALAVQEDPEDARCAHYYGRELMFNGNWSAAIAELTRCLALPRAKWHVERAASMRFIAKCHAELGDAAAARKYYLLACAEAPDARESWFDLAQHCMQTRDWMGGVWAVQRALAIAEAPTHYLRDARAWAGGPYDVGSVCAYYAGLKPLAREWLARALEFAPGDARLLENRKWIVPEAADETVSVRPG